MASVVNVTLEQYRELFLGLVMGAGVYQGVLGWAWLWVQGFIKVFWVGLGYGCRGLSRCFGLGFVMGVGVYQGVLRMLLLVPFWKFFNYQIAHLGIEIRE